MTDQTVTQETLADCIERLGLSIRAEFVPFSQSRNANEKHRSLNWRVTLVRRTMNENADARFRDILTTDYSAGIAHCPSYKASVKRLGHQNSVLRSRFIDWECENGKESHTNEHQSPYGHKSILPDAPSVIASLVLDADVLNHGSFEDWAGDFGYDVDSRNAEKTYRACLAIALQLRNGIGKDNLAALADAARAF